MDKKSRGTINYKVYYPKMDADNFMMGMLPKTMTLKFKGDKYSTTLSAGMGMFRTSFVFDKKENTFSQLVKLIDKKYVFQLSDEDITQSLSKLSTYGIEYTDEVKTIAGYVCKKVIVTTNDGSNDAFTAYYTEDIHIQTPNWATQFREIDGVLLEYQYEKYGICTRFVAEEVIFESVDNKEFEIPEDYSFVSQADMDEEMQAIFDSFE